MKFVRHTHTIKKGEIIPNTKKFGCVGRGDLTFLFKSCEIDRSQGRQEFYESTIRPTKILHNSNSLVYF